LIPKPVETYDLSPENIPLEVLYEDDELLVINKQPGLVCHPGIGNHRGTLINALVVSFRTITARKGKIQTWYGTSFR
jgi:23S rRNA pseudouridine1911/1915/1917 synthase